MGGMGKVEMGVDDLQDESDDDEVAEDERGRVFEFSESAFWAVVCFAGTRESR
jgi:hypothetical protein